MSAIEKLAQAILDGRVTLLVGPQSFDSGAMTISIEVEDDWRQGGPLLPPAKSIDERIL